MTVIAITVTESEREIVSGIPVSLTVQTNIPSNIYYTVDGSVPTVDSLILTGALTLPLGQPTVIFRYFATNGIDSSPIFEKVYQPDVSMARLPFGNVEGIDQQSNLNWGIFSDHGLNPNYRWSGNASIPMDTGIDGYPNGFDGTASGTTRGSTDLPKSDYRIVFSETDHVGKTGKGIGTYNPHVTILPQHTQFEQLTTNVADKIFNPRSLVIYQSWDNPPIDNISFLQRSMFSLERPEISDNGFNTGFDKGNVTGGLVKTVHNPADDTVTYYYRDSNTNQWIISKEKFHPKSQVTSDLSNVVTAKNQKGIGKVFQWIPFFYSRLR